jgi:hypothetical protein
MRRPGAGGHPCSNGQSPCFKRMDRGTVSPISTHIMESGKRRTSDVSAARQPFRKTGTPSSSTCVPRRGKY